MRDEDEETPYKKRAPKTKRFAIEYRATRFNFAKDWAVWKRYPSSEQRDQAFNLLMSQDTDLWEYRKRDDT